MTDEDLLKYNKLKNTYVEYRKITNTLKKQAKQAGRRNAPEVAEYEVKTKEFLRQMEKSRCNQCKHYKKHIKTLKLVKDLKIATKNKPGHRIRKRHLLAAVH